MRVCAWCLPPWNTTTHADGTRVGLEYTREAYSTIPNSLRAVSPQGTLLDNASEQLLLGYDMLSDGGLDENLIY